MTAPTRAYPDAELVLMALLEQRHPTVTVDTWLPGDVPAPFIHLMRIGGAPDAADVTDYPVMRVACYGDTRQQAWDLSRAVEVSILSRRYRNIDVPDVGPVLVDAADIYAGGQLTPDLEPDDRRVVVDYVLGWRRQ